MTIRRLVGIDLGIASAHTVRVLDETGTTLAKRRAYPTVESLLALVQLVLGVSSGGRLRAGHLGSGVASRAPSRIGGRTRGHARSLLTVVACRASVDLGTDDLDLTATPATGQPEDDPRLADTG